MKKVILIMLICAVPAILTGQAGFGIAAFYNTPIEAGSFPDEDQIHTENFTFGGDLRLKLGILHGEALALVTLDPFVTDIFLDAGITLDILIVRLAAGIGPKFTYGGEDRIMRGGYNLKLNADIILGKISLGLSYIFNTTLGSDLDVRGRSGMFGVSLLFWGD
jgi:hypothetical protein